MTTPRCIFCREMLHGDNTDDEHLPPKTLGFWWHGRYLICKPCNSYFGSNLDDVLERLLDENQLHHGQKEIICRNVDIQGKQVTLGVDRSGHGEPINPKLVDSEVNGEELTQRYILSSSGKSFSTQLKGIARGHARRRRLVGISDTQRQQQALPTLPPSSLPAIVVRALGKIALETAAISFDSELILSGPFDDIREFVRWDDSRGDTERHLVSWDPDAPSDDIEVYWDGRPLARLLTHSKGRWIDVGAATHLCVITPYVSPGGKGIMGIVSLYQGTLECKIVLCRQGNLHQQTTTARGVNVGGDSSREGVPFTDSTAALLLRSSNLNDWFLPDDPVSGTGSGTAS